MEGRGEFNEWPRSALPRLLYVGNRHDDDVRLARIGPDSTNAGQLALRSEVGPDAILAIERQRERQRLARGDRAATAHAVNLTSPDLWPDAEDIAVRVTW